MNEPLEHNEDQSFPNGGGRRRESGASLVEYALLVALIALGCFLSVTYLGESTGGSLDDSASTFASSVD